MLAAACAWFASYSTSRTISTCRSSPGQSRALPGRPSSGFSAFLVVLLTRERDRCGLFLMCTVTASQSRTEPHERQPLRSRASPAFQPRHVRCSVHRHSVIVRQGRGNSCENSVDARGLRFRLSIFGCFDHNDRAPEKESERARVAWRRPALDDEPVL